MSSAPHSSPPSSPSIRHVVWLAILIYILLAIFLTFFSPKASAGQEGTQAQLLDDMLGRLEYTADGKFVPVDDPRMSQELAGMVASNKLDGQEASAYILSLSRHTLAWGAASAPRQFETQAVQGDYAMKLSQVGNVRVAVQNFWVKQADGQHEEFQMVLALPAN
ncbi:MAG: hypothetical protein PHE17_08175 [Thiothrix sp.]|uniref:hypothetical protein n=1 Tax=Thiothrix sp. TaxID=1032 RepID=UPI002605D61F|nr:hypothetical protein [Thiothrix sp.]MDD5392976.1 hypothetical protein [Thiothrix sp.]